MMLACLTTIFVANGQGKPVTSGRNGAEDKLTPSKTMQKTEGKDSIMKQKINEYATVKLTTDVSKLTDSEKKVISLLMEASKIIDDLYWQQTWGNKKQLMKNVRNADDKKFVAINYGPWDRLDNNKSFLTVDASQTGEKPTRADIQVATPVMADAGNPRPLDEQDKLTDEEVKKMMVNTKPLGANFYPRDMTKDEFNALDNKDKKSLYTVIRRSPDKSLEVIWYHEVYKEQLNQVSDLMKKAADICEDKEFSEYLKIRAEALLSSDYQPSDMAWMDMKKNHLDFVVGPIENYEDAMFEYKAAFEAFVLVKDMDWSRKLEKYIEQLPVLQKELPVIEDYKKEVPGTSSDLGVYDAVYYAGDCNAGGKTIAINLPNDEEVQLKKGSRRIQLKNTMQAKFDKILMPIAKKLIDESQIKNVKFDAFFNNVMFHEVAHGLGIKNTVNGKGTVRESLKDVYSAFEEAKADILGLFMVTKLIEKGEVKDLKVEDCYVTFMAGIFRSVRFGAASAHGKANMMCFNYFSNAGVFKLTEKGMYVVNFENMKKAVDGWASTILTLQGNGDYDGAVKYLKANAVVNPQLQKELDGLKSANIPKDIIFEQGTEVMGF